MNPDLTTLLKRGAMALEDAEWGNADAFFERVLDIDHEHAPAYIGKLCAELKCPNEDALANVAVPLENSPNYKKALRFAHGEYRTKFEGYNEAIIKRLTERDESLSSARARIARYRGCLLYDTSTVFGLRTDGTVLVAGGYGLAGESEVGGMRDIVEIASDTHITAALNAYGNVTAVGTTYDLKYRGYSINNWGNDFIAIALRENVLYGLRKDGTVTSVGKIEEKDYGQRDVTEWYNIIAISAGYEHTVGLKSDGTVVAVGRKKGGRCDTQSWRGIVAISASFAHTVGLMSDGTVVATGSNEAGECNTGSWQDIVAINTKIDLTFGLRSDGTLIATGEIKKIPPAVFEWRDIVVFAGGKSRAVGLKSDGTVVAAGENDRGWHDVQGWKNIGLSTEEHRAQRRRKDEQVQYWMSHNLCRSCGSRFKGLLSKICSNDNCGKPKDYQS